MTALVRPDASIAPVRGLATSAREMGAPGVADALERPSGLEPGGHALGERHVEIGMIGADP